MIKRLLTAFLALTVALVSFAAPPQKAGASAPKGVRLTQKQIETIRAVHPWMAQKSARTQIKSSAARFPRLATIDISSRAVAKVNPSGSKIQGWRATDEFAEPEATRGWYELNLDGTQNLKWEYHDPDWVDDGWSEEPDFPFIAGFYRNGKVYGFHGELIFYWLVWGHGTFTLDGEISDYVEFGDDFSVTDLSTYVISCGYDQEKDMVYAYTLNADGSGYQLQSVNPESWQFKVINPSVNIEDVCVGLAQNPVDKKIYGLTPDGRFVTLDTATGALTLIKKFSYPVNTQMYGMTYSPLDKAFVVVKPEDDSTSGLYTIDPLNPQLNRLATLENTVQYRILVTPDKLIDPKAPSVAEIVSVDFLNGSTTGKASVKLPSETFDGSSLSGSLILVANIDGANYSEVSGRPGATVEVPFSGIEEGMRTFSFTVKSGALESAATDRNVYVGFDTPLAPQNIELSEGTLTWDAVTGTVSGGYLDEAALTYNVYLNGEKINSTPITGCSYTFTMPDALFRKYVAQVEAVNHGHASARGFSNDIKYGNPFPLPFTMAPTEAEGELVKVVSNKHPYVTWHMAGIDEDVYCFYCQTRSYEPTEEWMFLPAIDVAQSDRLVEISFDVYSGQYSEVGENLTVTVGSSQDPSSSKVVKEWKGIQINGGDWQRYVAYCLPAAGKQYVGFSTRTHENGNSVRIRNIAVRVSDKPSTTPAEPTGLKAEALPKGALEARVTFKMPEVNCAGGELTDANLTATIKTAAETKIVYGAPGTEQSVEIATSEGLNEISVSVSNGDEGPASKTSVFTGVDIPNPIVKYTVSHNADYKGLHIEWEDPTTGVNGGYVDPDNVTYALCAYSEEEYGWVIVEDLGNVSSYDAYFENVPNGIAIAEIGLLSKNEKGNCGRLLIANGTVGKPYTLPMAEKFSVESVNSYGPMIESRPSDDYVSQWGYATQIYPEWADEPSPVGPGAYVCSGTDGQKARMVLPAFSTESVSSAGIEVPLNVVEGKGEIRIYAQTFGTGPELIGTYDGAGAGVWKKCRFHLPSKFLDRKWVEIMIDGVFKSEEESNVSFAQYKIKTFYLDDIAVIKADVPPFPVVGSAYEITATVENTGLLAAESPAVELQVVRGDETLASLTMARTDGSGRLSEFGQAEYKTVWTPGAQDGGDVKLIIRSVNPDMDPTNDSRTIEVSIGRGNNPVVTDLVAEDNGSGVTLSWTEPTVETGHESFESFASFSYGDHIGDFKTVSLDGEESSYFGNFRFPHDIDAKAWQVIGDKAITEIIEAAGFENTFLKAADGDKLLVAFTPHTIYVGSDLTSDRWLISPEVKGGSKFSFQMSAGVTGNLETVEVLYSATDDNPESFTLIEEFKLLSAGWKDYEYTLPAEAKYFAIRYQGNTESGFFVLLDDIHYVPAAESPVLEGYDIYRNGMLIAENVNAPGSYADGYKPENATYYNIKPVVRSNGVSTRGLISNTAYVGLSAIVEVEESADGEAEYYSIQGIRVDNPANGIYIKRKGAEVTKVLIR